MKGKKLAALLAAIVSAVFLGAFAAPHGLIYAQSGYYNSQRQGLLPNPRTITVNLSALNNSGESGTAVLTAVGNNLTRVTLNLTGARRAIAQPAHIHNGSCPNPGNIAYPLNSVRNGRSTTVIRTSLNRLLNRQPLAINVHQSRANFNNYVACGNISVQTSQNPSGNNRTVAFSGSEFRFDPATITVNQGDVITINFTNNGTQPHSWGIDEFNVRTSTINPGQTASVTFTANRRGTFQYYCNVDNHRGQGMVGTLIVR